MKRTSPGSCPIIAPREAARGPLEDSRSRPRGGAARPSSAGTAKGCTTCGWRFAASPPPPPRSAASGCRAGRESLAHSLSGARQLEVDRRLLERVGKLGLLSPEAVAALAAPWDQLAGEGGAKADAGRRAATRCSVCAVGSRGCRAREPATASSGSRRLAARPRPPSPVRSTARTTRRSTDTASPSRRRAISRRTSSRSDCRSRADTAREKALQEALGRWNDLQNFRARLARGREESQRRGTVILAGELDHLLASLEPLVASARAAAVAASRQSRAGRPPAPVGARRGLSPAAARKGPAGPAGRPAACYNKRAPAPS